MRSKMLTATLLIGTILMGMAGCEKNTNHGLNPDKPVTITLQTYYNGAAKVALDEAVTEFNDTVGAQQGIYIESSSSGSLGELQESLEAVLTKPEDERNLPDIFGCYPSTAFELQQEELLADLQPYFAQEEIDEYVAGFMEEGRFAGQDQLYMIPVAKSVETLTINQTDWNSFAEATGASLDSFYTWEGIAAVAKQYYEWTDSLTETPNDGAALFGRDAFANYVYVGMDQLGGTMYETTGDSTTIQIDKESMGKLWDCFYVPYISGYYTKQGRFSSDDMKTGVVLGLVGSSSSGSYLPTEVTKNDGEPYAIDVICMPVPNFEGTEAAVVQQGAGLAVSASNDTRQYAAAVFLKWFTQEEVNNNFALSASYLPVKVAANTEETLKAYADENPMSQVAYDTLAAAMEQCNNAKLYTQDIFKGSSECRTITESAMMDLAKADREQVVTALVAGSTLEEAIAPYMTDEYFEQWLAGYTQQLEAACK